MNILFLLGRSVRWKSIRCPCDTHGEFRAATLESRQRGGWPQPPGRGLDATPRNGGVPPAAGRATTGGPDPAPDPGRRDREAASSRSRGRFRSSRQPTARAKTPSRRRKFGVERGLSSVKPLPRPPRRLPGWPRRTRASGTAEEGRGGRFLRQRLIEVAAGGGVLFEGEIDLPAQHAKAAFPGSTARASVRSATAPSRSGGSSRVRASCPAGQLLWPRRVSGSAIRRRTPARASAQRSSFSRHSARSLRTPVRFGLSRSASS